MIAYRVVLKIGYYERWFEFDDVKKAAEFAETVLMHQVPSEDHKLETVSVTIKVVDVTKEKQEEE